MKRFVKRLPAFIAGLLFAVAGVVVADGLSSAGPVMGVGVPTFLATPSSANFAAAITDETGTGLAVLATAPTLSGLTNSANGAASTPAESVTGSVFTGGSATTTKPLMLIEPTGTASTNWSTSGTPLGINAVSGFAGNLLDLQVAATRKMRVASDGQIIAGIVSPTSVIIFDSIAAADATTANNRLGQFSANTGGNVGGIVWRSNSFLRWTNVTTDGANGGTSDTGITRNAAGVIEINDGLTAGTLRDIKFRHHTFSGNLISTGIETDTASATITATNNILICNKATAMTETIPTSGFAVGQFLTVKNIGAGACTVDSNTGNKIDNAQTYVLSAQWQSVTMFCQTVSSTQCTQWLIY